MLSKKTNTNFQRWDLKTSFMTGWKVAGALVRPKGMALISKCLSCVLKAILEYLPISFRFVGSWTSNPSLENTCDQCNSARKLILDRDFVKRPVINTKSPRAFFF